MFRDKLTLLLFLLVNFCKGNVEVIDSVTITKATTNIDVSSHIPKFSHSVVFENSGKKSLKSFTFVIDPALKLKNISSIKATTKSPEGPLSIALSSEKSSDGGNVYQIQLSLGLPPEKSIPIEVEVIFTNGLEPYPSHITQGEKQQVKFSGSLYLYSPYKIASQTTSVKLSSSNIESYTKTKPVSVSDNIVNYGPFENVSPFSQSMFQVHYENNSPFLAVTQLNRLIEISHWGNIAVEETLDVRHSGAILKGSFSRFDFQRTHETPSCIKSYKTILPASATDVYYRDEIGNISTSNLKELDDSVEVELRPRFPLFGGWKTHYTLGYNVPSYQYLYNKGSQYILKMRFVDHIFDEQVVDNMQLKIILPEGAKKIHLVTPYDVSEAPINYHYTYLDTVGRPVIVAQKTSLVDAHIQDFELHYEFPQYLLLQEPLLLVIAFYILFASVIVYVRLDFSITRDEASETKMRVAGIIEQVQGLQDRRSALYQSYEDSINKYKSTKDSSAFNANRKKIDSDHKNLTQQIAGLLTKLKLENSEVADKIGELQRLDGLVRDQVTRATQNADKFITGKMTKQQYLDAEASINSSRDDAYQKMESFLGTL